MNKERYNQIINDAYKNFKNNFPMKKSNPPKDYINSKGQLLTKEEFINKIKTDDEFSEKWGLKIEERTVFEQVDQNNPVLKGSTALYSRKLITVTYNNETIKFYDNNP
jgi:hypothetical protein